MLKNTSFNLNNTLEDALSRENDISLLLSAGDQASDGRLAEYKGFASSPILKKIPVATARLRYFKLKNFSLFIQTNVIDIAEISAITAERKATE